jgi:cytochrome c
MDSWELNKIAGAVLCALLAILLPKTLMDLRVEAQQKAAKGQSVGYTLPGAEPAAAGKGGDTKLAAVGGGAAAAAPAADIFASVKPLLASAKPDAGAAVFKACAACHSVEKGGANRVGPALWGIVGRNKAAVDGFGYSAALKGMGGAWTQENLVKFIQNPKGYAAGTKMVYAGLNDPQRLADLVAYLNTLSDSPKPLAN